MSRGKKNPLTWQDPKQQKSGLQRRVCEGGLHTWSVSGVKGETEYLECRSCDATSQRSRNVLEESVDC